MAAQLPGPGGRVERPQADDGILTGCGKALSVGRNGKRPQRRCAGRESAKLLAGRHIPFAHNAVISGAEQASAVRAERDCCRAARMMQFLDGAPTMCVADYDGSRSVAERGQASIPTESHISRRL